MSIALAGAHRTGKSTLAKATAEELGWVYVPSRAGQVAKAMGVDFTTKMPSAELVIELQEGILAAHMDDLSRVGGRPWITDRSALDMATYCTLYALGEAHPRLASRVLNYIERCFDVANRHCAAIVLVQPGIPYVAATGKPSADPLYQEAFNTHLWGLMCDRRLHAKHAWMRRSITDLEERKAHVVGLVRRLQEIGKAQIPEGILLS
jgi:nicotinamide riboside kinase